MRAFSHMKKSRVWGFWKITIGFQKLSTRVLCTYRDNVQSLIWLLKQSFLFLINAWKGIWYTYFKSVKTRRIWSHIKKNKRNHINLLHKSFILSKIVWGINSEYKKIKMLVARLCGAWGRVLRPLGSE